MPYVITRRGSKVQSLKAAGFPYQAVNCGTSHAKGAWTEMVSSLATAVRSLDIVMLGAGTGTWYLMDVGIGAAGAEVVILPNLQMQTFNDFGNESRIYRFPYRLAAGTRVAMRGQCSNAAVQAIRAAILANTLGHGEGHQGVQRVVAYGHNLTNTQGIQVDPGGTVNTKGAWTQVVAATTYPIRRLALAVVPPTNVVFCSWAVDIGVGAAGAEVVAVPDVPFHAADIGKSIGPCVEHFELGIPAGQRLSLRAQCDSNNATGRLFTAVLHGQG